MNFLRYLSHKKEIKNVFDKSNTIYENLTSCLIPSSNVFYHYKFVYLGMTRSAQTITMQDLKNSFNDYEIYFKQYIENYNNFVDILKQDAKLKEQFKPEMKKYQKKFINLRESMYGLATSITTIPKYEDIAELMFIYRSINSFKKNFFFTNQFETQNSKQNNSNLCF